MGQITVTTCPIEGLYVIVPAVHGDARGYFMETYNRRDMEEAGLNLKLCAGQSVRVQEGRAARPSLPEGVSAGQAGACHPRPCL